ncbi:hypothetical protein [Hyphomonas atlantica corrig.]|nr:hypothetical protein [Hyphomonas atlantica]
MSTQFDDPQARKDFRKSLMGLGYEEVKYRLAAKKYGAEKAALVEIWLDDFANGRLVAEELADLSERISALRSKFVKGDNLTGMFLRTDDSAKFERLFVEASELLRENFGPDSGYYRSLETSYSNGTGGWLGGPSFACVTEISEILMGASERIARRKAPKATVDSSSKTETTYISPKRIDELKQLNSETIDFAKLIRLCEELNSAYSSDCFFSVAMIARSIIDHVPAAFGKNTFNDVTNHHGSRSFKKSMEHLHVSLRNIADSYLHEGMRKKEALPNANQVDVRRELDVLLAELVRLN